MIWIYECLHTMELWCHLLHSDTLNAGGHPGTIFTRPPMTEGATEQYIIVSKHRDTSHCFQSQQYCIVLYLSASWQLIKQEYINITRAMMSLDPFSKSRQLFLQSFSSRTRACVSNSPATMKATCNILFYRNPGSWVLTWSAESLWQNNVAQGWRFQEYGPSMF